MKSDKIQRFMEIADQSYAARFSVGSEEERKLGAQLLLSEVLEYVIHGLGLTPIIQGQAISEPNELEFETRGARPDKLEMVDGLADVAYTMYWNSVKFAVPLEEAFELVCENNLSKFVQLPDWKGGAGPLQTAEWSLGQGVSWPDSVVSVEVVKVRDSYYAVGKNASGKVQKPSTFQPVNLEALVS